ncbi:MAG: hypothetical protein C4289_06655 [Chloroflexota bacterium]
MPLPCWAVGLSPMHGRIRWLELNCPVVIDSMTVRPGDIIYADVNGALVIPAEVADQVYDKAREVREREQAMFARLREPGMTLEKWLAGWARSRAGVTGLIAPIRRGVGTAMRQAVSAGLAGTAGASIVSSTVRRTFVSRKRSAAPGIAGATAARDALAGHCTGGYSVRAQPGAPPEPACVPPRTPANTNPADDAKNSFGER